MNTITQPLRDEHRELLPKIERIRVVADSVGFLPVPILRAQLAELHTFLVQDLVPHARVEDVALYPVIAEVMGAPDATATMRHDHVEVAGLVEELGALEPELAAPSLPLEVERALRRILYGLYTLVKVHLVEEEEIYLPLLDAGLSGDEAKDLFHAMEVAATREREEALRY